MAKASIPSTPQYDTAVAAYTKTVESWLVASKTAEAAKIAAEEAFANRDEADAAAQTALAKVVTMELALRRAIEEKIS